MPSLLTFSDFTLYQSKGDGVTDGGFYTDKNEVKWLIKEGHWGSYESVIKEYVAGAIFQKLLGDNAPQTVIIWDKENNRILTGSKVLAHFSTFSDHFLEQNSIDGYWSWYHEFGDKFPTEFKGVPFTGFAEAVTSILWLADQDAHLGNTGFIDHGDHISFAKIDHGLTFEFGYPSLHNLDEFRDYCLYQFNFKDLGKVGYEPLLKAITSIADRDFADIQQTIDTTVQQAKQYLQAIDSKYMDIPNESIIIDSNGNELSAVGTTIETFATYISENLQERQGQLKKIANFMQLEKAIIDHDVSQLVALNEHELILDKAFKPFFYPISVDDYYQHIPLTTGLTLIEEKWPEKYLPLVNNLSLLKDHAIDIKEVLMIDSQPIELPPIVVPEYVLPQAHLPVVELPLFCLQPHMPLPVGVGMAHVDII